MNAKLSYCIDIGKWVIDVQTENGEFLPVGKLVDEELQLFDVEKWDTRDQAVEWINSRNLTLYSYIIE